MTNKRALIVDDEPDIRELLEITLGRMHISTRSAENVQTAKTLLQTEVFDFCLTDMKLPDGNGIELVQYISDQYPKLPVAMITAHGNMDSAVDALKAGAFDFVSKPVNLEQLRNLVDIALNLKPAGEDDNADTELQLLGNTQVMKTLRKQITKLARSQAPIYISGESGSGKELVARLIHEQGPHPEAPFIPVNCGAIPSELMESEFFGHKKGSFTGAATDKEGLFQAANGGTLFLDEVADLPLLMQVKLLRGIQEKAIRPIGSQQEVSVNVRILSATHKDLAAEVELDKFRQDLYYRINVIELKVPSLRERIEDIPMLAVELLSVIADDYSTNTLAISDDAISALMAYHFPGNVRELANILERAFTLCEDDTIKASDLRLSPAEANVPQNPPTTASDETAPQHSSPQHSFNHNEEPGDTDPIDDKVSPFNQESKLSQSGDSLEAYLEDIEKNVIIEALESTRWNKTAAAKKLGLTFRALRYRLKKLGLE